MEYDSAIKEEKILPFATAWVEVENLMLSEISQSEKTHAIGFHSYGDSNGQTGNHLFQFHIVSLSQTCDIIYALCVTGFVLLPH